MGSSAGGPPPTQEQPEWLPNPEPVAVVEAPPAGPGAPPPAAPPPLWQQPSSPSRLPLITGSAVIALVLVGGGYWFLRDSNLFQQQPTASRDVVTQPTNQASQYDRADRIVNKVLAPDLVLIADKLNQGSGACSGYTPTCRAALENLEPALAKSVADIDSADVPFCIRTELQAVRTDLSNMDKAALGAVAMMKTGQDDYGRTMAAAVGQSYQKVQLDMPPLNLAFRACPRA